ncbi:MAG: diguanylate cyclase [Nitrospirae bacterium]|nr:diguanylate cyclase [Nitrospirota bacterium]
MKVRTRLTYSHGIIIATLIAVCVISIVMCRTFRDMINEIVSERYVKTIYIDNIQAAVTGIDLSIHRLLIANGKKTDDTENIETGKRTIVENISKLELLIKRQRGKQLLKSITDLKETYFSFIREQTDAIANQSQSIESILQRQSKNSAMFAQAVIALTDYQTQLMKESEAESRIEYNRYTVMAMSVTAGLLIISFLIGIKVVRSIGIELGAEPKEISTILMNMAEDNLHYDYELLRGKDQKGILKYASLLLDKLKERDYIVKSELAMTEELAANNFLLKRRETLQDTIKSVLEISLEQIPLKSKLERVLDIIVSIPDISIENKGCIHLRVDNADALMMAAQRNLHESLVTQCAHLKFGQCLCGLAASTGKVVFSNKIDDLHTVRFEGMHEHGHYCLPIKTGHSLLGVLCLYVKPNREKNREEENTFISITNAIAAIIEHGKAEEAINRINKFTRTVINSINDSIIVLDVSDFTIVSTNNAFLKNYRVLDNEVIGRHCYEITHKVSQPCNQQEYSCPVMNMLRTGEYSLSEHLHFDDEGKEVYVSCSASPIRDDSGKIVQCVYVLRNISQRKFYEKQLQQLAHYDTVTSLPNRMLLLDRLSVAIEFSIRESNMMAILFIDLDKFKSVNDTYGHETGDQLLREVSKRLLAAVRDTDTVSRIGGDEFIVLLSKISGKDNAAMLAGKIIQTLNNPFFVNGHQCNIGGSIGIEVYPLTDDNHETGSVSDVLIKRADMAMYKAKELGKNRYEFYTRDLSADIVNPMFK